MSKTDFLAPPDLRIVGSRLSIAGTPQFSLAAMGTAKLPDGALVYVQSVKAYFQLDRGSTAAPDGSTVVSAFLGAGNWLRLDWNFAGESPWLSQTDWYIDELTGSDDNDGATAATALKSPSELQRRLGSDPLIDDVQIDVWILSDLSENIELSARFRGNNAGIWIHGGVKSVLASDTIKTWTSYDNGSEPGIEGNSISDFSAYAGYRVTFTSGTQQGRSTFLGREPNSTAVGNEDWRHGTIAYWSPGITNLSPATAFRTTNAAPAVGNGFQIEELRSVPGLNLRAADAGAGTTSGFNLAGFVVSDLAVEGDGSGHALNWFTNDPRRGEEVAGYRTPVLLNCVVDNEISGSSVQLTGCRAGRQGDSTGVLAFSGLDYVRVDGLVCRVVSLSGVSFSYDTKVMLEDGTFTLVQNSQAQLEAGIWRTGTGYGVVSAIGCVLKATEVWGASTGGGTGWRAQGSIYYDAIAKINGFVCAFQDARVGTFYAAYGGLPSIDPANNAMMVLTPV